jgi:hypothetical protein
VETCPFSFVFVSFFVLSFSIWVSLFLSLLFHHCFFVFSIHGCFEFGQRNPSFCFRIFIDESKSGERAVVSQFYCQDNIQYFRCSTICLIFILIFFISRLFWDSCWTAFSMACRFTSLKFSLLCCIINAKFLLALSINI